MIYDINEFQYFTLLKGEWFQRQQFKKNRFVISFSKIKCSLLYLTFPVDFGGNYILSLTFSWSKNPV